MLVYAIRIRTLCGWIIIIIVRSLLLLNIYFLGFLGNLLWREFLSDSYGQHEEFVGQEYYAIIVGKDYLM